jgi:hypothetical protein
LIVKIIGLVAGVPVVVTMFIWAVGVGSPHSYFLKEIFVVAAISRALRSGYDGEEQGNVSQYNLLVPDFSYRFYVNTKY